MVSTAAILPPVLRDQRGLAFAAAVDAAIDIDTWLACPLAVEHAPDVVLWELARQFDIAGPLYQAMATRTQKERLVRSALRLQRKRGTPWSVEEVMRLLGFTDAKVLDRTNILLYDGEAIHDGTYVFNAYFSHWNQYIIRLCLDANSRAFTEFDREQATLIAADWSPLRSELIGWEIRHLITSYAIEPAYEAARVYQIILFDKTGNRQYIENDWTQIHKNNSVNLRWRLPQGQMTLSEVALVALGDRNNDVLFKTDVPVVAAAPNVTLEGVWTIEVLQ